MERRATTQAIGRLWVAAALLLGGSVPAARAQDAVIADDAAAATAAAAAAVQDAGPPGSTFEIYGFVMLDIGHNFTSINPNWFDTMRVTKLPSFADEFGEDGSTFAGVRQTRLGVRSSTPTALGNLKTTFEFELFGTGADEGQTTFRLRHAYGELGSFGAGQWWSPFIDPDVYPNIVEYWGPTGMVLFRNVQVRWMANKDEHGLILAVERPGASGDQGVYADRVELSGIQPRFPWPDFSGAYKYSQDWGYVRGAGILRAMNWDDTRNDAVNLSGDAVGWGINLSSNIKFGSDTVRLQYVFGEGIQNYMNDSPVDVGVVNNLGNVARPVVGEPVPIRGLVAFLDHTWNEHFTSSVGYSHQDNDNTDAQSPSAFRDGDYAVVNLLYNPVPFAMAGAELQWGRRENFSDGFSSDGFKVQFSFKYNFSYHIGN